MTWKLIDLLDAPQREALQQPQPRGPRQQAAAWTPDDRVCPTAKTSFATKAEAWVVVQELGGRGMKPYRCAYCMQFHLGHPRGSRCKSRRCVRCKTAKLWQCRHCGVACCEHRCTYKAQDGTCCCSACWRKADEKEERYGIPESGR